MKMIIFNNKLGILFVLVYMMKMVNGLNGLARN